MNRKYFDRLVKIMNQRKIDAMLLAPSEELEFILGHTTHICERFQALIVKSNGDYFYVCNLLTVDEIKEFMDGHKVYGWFDGDGFIDTVKKAFEENNLIGKTIAVNSTERAFLILQMIEAMNIKFVNGKPILEELRLIKDDEEIANLRKAAQITDEVFLEIIKFIKPGQKEEDIATFIDNEFIKRGARPGFSMVISGPNTAYPHYCGNQRVIQDKDIVLLDYGCIYNNLCSDMSRTVFVGEITDEQRKVYEIVRKAQAEGVKKAVNGAYIPDVDKAARDIIKEAGYGEYFSTRLGHGIGYSVHEAPDIKQNHDRTLAPGMAFSVEPGIYMAGKFGLRIEDIVVITKSGHEVLNKASKEIIIL